MELCVWGLSLVAESRYNVSYDKLWSNVHGGCIGLLEVGEM